MYCIEVLKSGSFQNPPQLRTEYNRDCSFHIGKRGIILHSALQRSTCFVGSDKPTFEPVCRYLEGVDQPRRNRFIEAFFLDAFPTVEDCIAHAEA